MQIVGDLKRSPTSSATITVAYCNICEHNTVNKAVATLIELETLHAGRELNHEFNIEKIL